jgi:hypothetical protein
MNDSDHRLAQPEVNKHRPSVGTHQLPCKCSLLTLIRHGPLRVPQERPRAPRYCCQAGRRLATNRRSLGMRGQSGIGGRHPSVVEAAIIYDLKALGTPAKEGIRALKLVPAGLAPGQQLQVPMPVGLLSLQGQCRVREADFEARSFQPAFHSPSPRVARSHASNHSAP